MDGWGLVELGAASAAVMAVVGLGTWLTRALRKGLKPLSDIRAATEATKAATKATLRYSIVRAHGEYMTKGKINRMALQCIFEMHEQYVQLGGNGFIKELVDELRTLPIDALQD